MDLKKINIIFFMLINISFLDNFLKSEEKEHKESVSIEQISDAGTDAQDYFLYLKATFQHRQAEYEKSLKTYESLFARKPPVYVYQGFINLMFDTGQFRKIIDLPQPVKEAFEDDVEVQLAFAQAHLFINQDKEAKKLFENLFEKDPNNPYVAYYTAVSYLKSNQVDKAVSFLDTCLKKESLESKHFLFYFLKSKAYLQLGQPKEALKFVEKSVELFPKFDKGWLFKALLSEQFGRVNEAIKGYKRFLDLTGRDTAIEKQLIHLLFLQKRFTEAAQILKKIPNKPPEAFFDLALIEWRSNNNKEALEYINKSLEGAPTFRKAKLLKVEILLAKKEHEKAVDFLGDWLNQDPKDIAVLHTFMLLRKAKVSTSLMIKKLESLEKKHRESIAILSALSDLCLEADEYKKAEESYKKLLDLTKEEDLKSKILFQLGYIYFVTKQKDKIEGTLKDAIKFESAYPSAYNLFAYHYAQENKNLDEALKLINKALERQPNNSAFIDTKGLVLLKKGKKEEAKKLFRSALEMAPGDKEIIEHLKMANNVK